MMWILRIVVFPLLLIVMFLHLLVKLATHLSSYVIGFFLLFTIACSIYSAVQAQWTSVALMAGFGFVAFLLLFFIVAIEMALEDAVGRCRGFSFKKK